MSLRHRPFRAVASAVIALRMLAPSTVLGHAELDTASPADKSTVAGSPPELVFTFAEPVDPKKSSLKLVDSSGAIVADGSSVDPNDAKKMHLVVPTQPPGEYTVRWTTASALDGDIAHGTTAFTIVAPSPSPSVAPESPTASASAAESPSASPSQAAPSASPSPSGGTGTPTSTSDAVIPVIAALIVLAALGLWLLRSRSRRVG